MAEERTESKTIRNRDVIKLSHVLYTMQDVTTTEQKRAWLQDRLWSMSQRITGMPGGGPSRGIDDKLAAIGELEEKYARESGAFLRELKECEDILNRIENREMRTFVTMKYVLDIKDTEIQNRLNMKRRRYEQCRKAIEQAPSMERAEWPRRFTLKK